MGPIATQFVWYEQFISDNLDNCELYQERRVEANIVADWDYHYQISDVKLATYSTHNKLSNNHIWLENIGKVGATNIRIEPNTCT